MSFHCSQIQNPLLAKSIASINANKASINHQQCSLVSGQKNIYNASVADLASGRIASINAAHATSVKGNTHKAINLLEMSDIFARMALDNLNALKAMAIDSTQPQSDSSRAV